MSGATPREAAIQHLDALQLQLSCITDSVLRRIGSREGAGNAGDIVLGSGLPIRLSRRSALALVIKQNYHLVEHPAAPRPDRWSLVVDTYIYRLLDLGQQEIIAWHWHPQDPSIITHHHLHLGPAAQVGRAEFHRAHLPTGIVTVADIVRSAIADFHVEPLRDDWRAILETAISPTP